MRIHEKIIDLSLRFPRTVMVSAFILLLGLGSLIPRVVIDTDPENMLPPDQAARVFHNQTKKDFTLYDLLVVGVVNEKDPDGVFNPATLKRVYELTRQIEKIDGVVRDDLLSLASVDNISQDGPGVVRFEWMLSQPPSTRDEALAVRDAARRLPTITGTIVSEDERAVGIYVPIEDKNESHRIATEIEEIVAGYQGDEKYYITGLPVAEDTFGTEMFRQMGIAAPLAGLIIFLLMWFFFRSIALILSPMIVAISTVAITMGLLIGMGYTVHIMSSMIPIFLMPIAVVDSVHILSEFADLYPRIRDRKKTIRLVMEDLFRPMLYTSLTSATGFASLMFAPIPPVRVFGAFVAIGILLAFLLTITFIPAYIVRLNDKKIARLCRSDPRQHDRHLLARILSALGPRTLARSKLIVAATAVIVVVSVVGISKIRINDNPVRWFRPSHNIRVADRVLNEHFGGTYNAYLVLKKAEDGDERRSLENSVAGVLTTASEDEGINLQTQWKELQGLVVETPFSKHVDALVEAVLWKIDEAQNDDEAYVWEDVLAVVEDAQTKNKYFQTPEVLHYIEGLQEALIESHLVGKSTSIADIVKTVHRELREGDAEFYSVPPTGNAVAQTFLSFQSSHRPQDLWHFLTPDLRQAVIWLQLKSGDNQDMVSVTEHLDRYLAASPPPQGVSVDWAGLTYLNVVWQDDMVSGMFNALMGSFVIVFFMMLILFRSFWFGLLSMLPLSVTIAFIYGLIGLAGKDYDMPVAVLSSLTLGLSVDFAIHFLQRTREIQKQTGDWHETIRRMFKEPARAISRNAIVIAIGFLPLLGSPLVPYNTVGFFLATIMAVSCAVTLLLLPAVMNLLRGRLFGKHASVCDRDTAEGPEEETSDSQTGGQVVKPTVTAVLAAVISAALLVQPAPAQDLTDVDQIIERANLAAYYPGDDGRALVRMTVSDAQGRERIRQFTILRKDVADGGDQEYAVLFSRPADVRNTVFLVKKHVGKDDDRWLYLPGLDLVKRIAAGDKRTSFVGSHFFYEDVSGRGLDEDDHTLVETTAEHYVVKSTPKDRDSVEFSSWTAWIDKKTFIPVKMDYVDDTGEVYRRIEALEVRDFQGRPTVTQMKASDLRAGSSTLSEFRNIQYDLNIPDDVFTERSLRNPSPEWFRGK